VYAPDGWAEGDSNALGVKRLNRISVGARRPPFGRLRLEDDRDGPVVDELELHPRSEGARLNLDPLVFHGPDEGFAERLGLLRTGRMREARAVALRRVL
jgi:hypothetical protein